MAKKNDTIFCRCDNCHGDREIKVEQFDKGEVICDECVKAKNKA